MDLPAKLKQISGLSCMACLRNDSNTNLPIFGEHELEIGIISAYKDLLKENATNLDKTPIGFCLECMEMLNNINKFKSKCLKSFRLLSKRVPAVVEKNEVDRCSSPVNMYEEYLDEAFDFQPNETIQEQPNKQNVLKTSKTMVSQPNPSKILSTLKTSIKGYCAICCYEHDDARKHAIYLHVKPCGKSSDNDSLKCLICEEDFKTVNDLLVHLEIQHKEFENSRTCIKSKCEVSLKVRRDFTLHVQSHYQNNTRIYICEFCNFVTETRCNLKYHLPKHFGALKCQYCHNFFFEKDQYTLHLQDHKKRIEQKNFICDYCGLSFNNKYKMLQHLQSQHVTAKETFKCQECGRMCKTNAQLKGHVKGVHGERNIPCPQCGKKFKLSGNLTVHIRDMHLGQKQKKRRNIRKISCDQCDMKFYDASGLKKHKYSHSNTRPYNCNICPTGYYSGQYLRWHFKREHGITYTQLEIRKICGFRLDIRPT